MPCAFILSEGSERIGARPRLHARILILHMIRIFATMLAALTGLAFGSFLNVCVTRWPAGESVVKPRSHCRSCARTLTWWENIPVVSWLALRGRCRTCGASISWRYPLVEFLVSGLWALIVWQHTEGLGVPGSDLAQDFVDHHRIPLLALAFGSVLLEMLFTWVLVGLAFLDAEYLWLPNLVTLPGVAIGIGCKTVSAGVILYSSRLDPSSLGCWDCKSPVRAALESAASAVLAAGLILIIRWAYWLVRRREGIGRGDAKLMAMLGAWLGLPCAVLSFVIGVVIATIAALALLAFPAARHGSASWASAKLPLGTFLCIGGIVSALWGWQIIAAYLRWPGF
jgi:leader peptidase (prepilin peptidase)/N-methyltransferase